MGSGACESMGRNAAQHACARHGAIVVILGHQHAGGSQWQKRNYMVADGGSSLPPRTGRR